MHSISYILDVTGFPLTIQF